MFKFEEPKLKEVSGHKLGQITGIDPRRISDKNIMVDKGLVDSIIGLPTPTPEKLTAADIEEITEKVQEKIVKDWQESEAADMAADLLSESKFEDEIMNRDK